MSVDPLKASSIPAAPDLGRAGQAGNVQATRTTRPEQIAAEAVAARNAADRVELSAESRKLVEEVQPATSGASASGLSPERMKQVLSRLVSGYYDRPEVQDQVAGRLAKDLLGS